MLAQPVQKRIVLAGRTFVPAGESTVEHDIEVMRLMRAAGLEASAAGNDDEFAWRALAALVEGGTLLPLVACLIVPEEHARRRPGLVVRLLERFGVVRRAAARGGWTPDVQAETVAFLKDLDEPRDKDQVYALVAGLLVPFVNGALRSWRPSPRSSGSPETATPEWNGSSPSADVTSGPGDGSFGSSAGTSPTGSPG